MIQKAIRSLIKKALPDTDQTSIENLAYEISLLLDDKLKQGAKQFSKDYVQRINRCYEPGSEVDRRLQGELGDMEKVLIANLSALR